MTIAAIIAEFNPFHNGHKLLIDEVRRQTGADSIIALMSGDYVQRGVPAVTNRQVRAEMALLNGVDVVLSYPTRYATASAESFAAHAVRLISRLNCVDILAFGSECGDSERLASAAAVLAEESDDYRERLREGLRAGLSFPKARAEALPAYADILDGPNNILGIEYIKAIMREKASLRPFTIARQGSSHLDDTSVHALSSAAAVRRALASGHRIPGLEQALPANAFRILLDDIGRYGLTSENDFSLLLADRIWRLDSAHILKLFADVNHDLAQAILKKRVHFRDFADFADRLKNKSLTRTHINRALLHLVLDIRKETEESDNLYAHVLGFRKESEALLGVIKDNCSLPFVTGQAKARELLTGEAQKLFLEEVRVSNLYETVRARKAHEEMRSVLSEPIIVVD